MVYLAKHSRIAAPVTRTRGARRARGWPRCPSSEFEEGTVHSSYGLGFEGPKP